MAKKEKDIKTNASNITKIQNEIKKIKDNTNAATVEKNTNNINNNFVNKKNLTILSSLSENPWKA